MFPSINLRQKLNTITLANRLLKHQKQMLNFLFDTPYDIIYLNFQHRHSSYLDNKQNKDLRTLKIEQMTKFYQEISQKLHTRILRDDIDLDRALYRLQLLWDHKQIPLFHRYYFEKYIYTAYLKNITSLVLNEQKLMRQQTHIYFNIIRAVFARESCIKALKLAVTQLNPNDVFEYLHLSKQQSYYQQKKLQKQKYQIQGYKVKKDSTDSLNQPTTWKTKLEIFGDNFTHLKKLTFYIIDMIVKWKQYIYSLTHDARKHRQKLSYYYMEENYMLKILKDLQFLKNTALINFYRFSEKNDPFLLSCILNIEMKQEKTLDDELLKKIIFPDQQQYYEIIRKLQILSKEFEANIQRRRLNNISKNTKTIHKNKEILLNFKTSSLNKIKGQNNIQSPSKIKKIDSQNHLSTSKLYQIKETPVKSRKIIQLRDSGIKLSTSRLVLDGKLRLSSSRLSNKNENYNQFKKQQILTQGIKKYVPKKTFVSETSRIESNKTEQESLVKLREDVVKKIKEQVTTTTNQSPKKYQVNDPLRKIIDKQISQVKKQMLSYQPDIEQNLKKPLHLITKSFKQQSIKVQLKKIFQNYPEQYIKMQIPYQQLELFVSKSFYCIIIEASFGTQKIGYVFCGLDLTNTTIKTIKIYHIMTYKIEHLNQLIMKAIEFLWKYQNSFEIQFKFFMHTDNESISQYLDQQKKVFEPLCVIISKQIYNNLKQIKYIFKRKSNNPRYLPNQYPLNLYICLRMIVSTQSLQNSNSQKQLNPETSIYEVMLSEIIKSYSTTDDLIALRERCNWKPKLKKILELILRVEKGEVKIPQITSIQLENITQINLKLKQNRQKLLELSDNKKNNRIGYISMKLLYEFQYQLQYARIHHIPYYKMKINNTINKIHIPNSPAYLIDTVNRRQKVLYMNAPQYQPNKSNLFLHMLSIIQFARLEPIQVKNLFIPMIRIPKQHTQRDESYIKTKKLTEFSLLKKELYYNQQVQFFSSLQLQNGVDLDVQSDDIIIQTPYIMAIIANNVPIYAKYIA